MNVFITGATGFIGRHLTEELSRRKKYKIFCLVRDSQKAKSLDEFGVEKIHADISGYSSILNSLKGKIDVVFHCAGYVSNRNVALLQKVNVAGTENICRLTLALGAERLVYVSSAAVVSGNDEVPLVEELPYKSNNIYGQSKIEAEKIVSEYRKKGLRAVIVRPPIVYGEREPHVMKILIFLLKRGLFPLFDHGRNKLHMVYVKNLTELMIFSLGRDEFLKGSFFVADNEILDIKKIVTIISNTVNARPPWEVPQLLKKIILFTPYLGGKAKFFLKDRIYSIDRIRSLGFEPPYSAESGLIQSSLYFR